MADTPDSGSETPDAVAASETAALDSVVRDMSDLDTPPPDTPASILAAPETSTAGMSGQGPVKAPEPAGRRAPAISLVLGGVLTAVVGFGVAQVVPQGWPLWQVSDLTAQMTAQSEAIAGLQTKLAEMRNAPVPKPDPAMSDRLAAVEAALAALPAPADIGPLTLRLDAVEQQMASTSVTSGGTGTVDPSVLAQLQSEIVALKSGGTALDAKMAEAAAKLDSLRSEAEAVMVGATRRAALHQLQAALDTGAPYASALADLPQDLPEALKAHADSGLPSLQMLRANFPQSARAALDASLRAAAGESWTDRVGIFLRGQTGARSLTPRDGTDPDAVLSRAEAAVAAGDLARALTELDALPQSGKDAMADWLAQAALRQDAASAVQALSASLGQ